MKLPDHNDYGDPCTHREAYENVMTHTRASTGSKKVEPDVCHECSKSVSEWVQWPCPRVKEVENWWGMKPHHSKVLIKKWCIERDKQGERLLAALHEPPEVIEFTYAGQRIVLGIIKWMEKVDHAAWQKWKKRAGRE